MHIFLLIIQIITVDIEIVNDDWWPCVFRSMVYLSAIIFKQFFNAATDRHKITVYVCFYLVAISRMFYQLRKIIVPKITLL